jgi:hypothetical protein
VESMSGALAEREFDPLGAGVGRLRHAGP